MTILVQQLKAEIEIFQEGCRKLAFQLSAGGYNADNLTAEQLIAKVQGGLDLFCESTSGWVQKVEAERNQLKAENAELIDLMRRVVAEHPRRSHKNDGNGPGHGHAIPGVWDEDNGELAGKTCAWCSIWNAAKGIVERHEQAMTKEQP